MFSYLIEILYKVRLVETCGFLSKLSEYLVKLKRLEYRFIPRFCSLAQGGELF